jgi:hypothetical protein
VELPGRSISNARVQVSLSSTQLCAYAHIHSHTEMNDPFTDPASSQYNTHYNMNQQQSGTFSYNQNNGYAAPPPPMYGPLMPVFDNGGGYPPPPPMYGNNFGSATPSYVQTNYPMQFNNGQSSTGSPYGARALTQYPHANNQQNCIQQEIPQAFSQQAIAGASNPPIAVPVFALRNEIGQPVSPQFVIEQNTHVGVLHISQVSFTPTNLLARITNLDLENPFTVRINEVLVCLGQEAAVVEYPVASGIYGVHIIQDRMTGKTMDVFIELKDWQEADRSFRRYNNLVEGKREPKLGPRRINLDMSTNSALMKAMFPRAKCDWVNGVPERSDDYLQKNPSTWDGFITFEELVKVLLFAEQTNSSKTRFAADSPERVYQFMMSSLQKVSHISSELISFG